MSFRDEKLVSIIVLSHDSRSTISRALHSVFVQDYPRLEIIVSDDGSKGISREYVEKTLESRPRDRIERAVFTAPETAIGMIDSLRLALDEAEGEFFIIINADEMLARRSVVSEYITMFAYRSWQPLLVSGLAEMRSEDMNTILRTIPDGCMRSALQNEDSELLYDSLARGFPISVGATCFHKSFIEKAGVLDWPYKYLVDYPIFLRMARKGISPAYIDRVMVKCPIGKVEDSDRHHRSAVVDLARDRAYMWKTEFDPYSKRVSKESRSRNKEIRLLESCLFQDRSRNKHRPSVAFVITRELKRVLFDKSAHRAILSLRILILIALISVGLQRVAGVWFVVDIVAVGACFSAVLSLLWFVALCLWKILARGRSRHGNGRL
ncbi:glycosyltransferase [Eggerthella timonensis]|uniref:glycosyltransferase n=1 Tax=Eggerthella timonensis TaxID=1871008 RepID=UPI000C78D144|nr:glycosyltransferase [Eggerthella timonensis]